MINTQDYKPTNAKRMNVGVHANVEVSSAEVQTTKTGKNLVKIHFTAPNGNVHERAVWFPDYSNVTPYEGESLQNAKDRVLRDYVNELVLINTAVYGVDTAHMVAEDVSSLANVFVNRVNSTEKKGTINLAVEWTNDDQYSRVPTKKYGWIEPFVANVSHTLELEKFKMTKDSTGGYGGYTSSSTVANEFNTAEASASNDLPF